MSRGSKTPEQDRTEGTARPRGYEQVDKLSVPLPHGTEVTTRVERVAGDQHIPQGVVGRVVRACGGGFDVQKEEARSGLELGRVSDTAHWAWLCRATVRAAVCHGAGH